MNNKPLDELEGSVNYMRQRLVHDIWDEIPGNYNAKIRIQHQLQPYVESYWDNLINLLRQRHQVQLQRQRFQNQQGQEVRVNFPRQIAPFLAGLGVVDGIDPNLAPIGFEQNWFRFNTERGLVTTRLRLYRYDAAPNLPARNINHVLPLDNEYLYFLFARIFAENTEETEIPRLRAVQQAGLLCKIWYLFLLSDGKIVPHQRQEIANLNKERALFRSDRARDRNRALNRCTLPQYINLVGLMEQVGGSTTTYHKRLDWRAFIRNWLNTNCPRHPPNDNSSEEEEDEGETDSSEE